MEDLQAEQEQRTQTQGGVARHQPVGSPVFIGIISDSQLLPPLQLLLQPFAIKPLTRFSHRLWFRTCSHRHSES